ncbi:MAG: hypothetical protein ABIQ15_03810 [Nocardioides sp.]
MSQQLRQIIIAEGVQPARAETDDPAVSAGQGRGNRREDKRFRLPRPSRHLCHETKGVPPKAL